MNLGFLVDGSAIVELSGKGNFNKSLDFVASMIGSFDVSQNATRPGMVVFSQNPHLVFNFSRHENSVDAMADVRTASYPNSGRKIGKALNFVRRKLFSESSTREEVSNYLIFLTNGASYDFVETPAKLLHEQNVTIFSIGIGNDYSVEELKLITGYNDTRVYTTTYQDLQGLQKTLKKEICRLQELSICGSSPCLNGGTCINTGANFRCICARGYYGKRCQLGCGFGELGLKIPNERRIPGRFMTSSSQRDSSHAAHRARVGIKAIGTYEDGWCSAQTDIAPWIQVFFEYLVNITEIETEGVEDGTTELWVESYYVSISNSTAETSFVNYTEGGKTRIFKGNTNISATNNSLHGTNAHFVRIHPVNHTGPFACLRLALYGCDTGEDFISFTNTLLERIDNAPLSEDPVSDTLLAALPVAVFAFLLLGSLMFLMLPLSSPSVGQPLRSTSVQLNQDSPSNGMIPMAPMFEVQSLSMQLGEETKDFQVEGVNSSSEDAIFSSENKIFSFDRQVSVSRDSQLYQSLE